VILIIDDEAMIREVTSEVATLAGFHVSLAKSGREGVEILRNDVDRVGCVLLDWTMPDEDGEAIFHELRAIAPTLPIIITSGYDLGPDGVRDAHTSFLAKPFTGGQMLQAFRRWLEPR